MQAQGIFDFGPNPHLRGGPSPFDGENDLPERIVLAAKGFRLFDGSWEINVIEGEVRVESASGAVELLRPHNATFSEAIKVVAGDKGCTLNARQNLPKKMY